MTYHCGFDFGTSNTVVTLIDSDGSNQRVFSDSSVLFLPDCGPRAQRRHVGAGATEEYVASGMNGRFIQSIKTVLPDPGFVQTTIFGKSYTPEELVAMIIQDFKKRIEDHLGEPVDGAVFGRPARFSDVEESDNLAEGRLRAAAERCGFRRIEFQYEPVAAASRYATSLSPGACALVCDFGGGTSDFSVIRIDEAGELSIPATHGVRIGGDDFDGQIMWHRLVPYFGYGSDYESYGKLLPVPVHIYRTICHWERIPFLKTTEYREDLKYIRNGAVEKSAVEKLISLIDDDLGYALFQAIRTAKHSLSESDSAAVRFFEKDIELKERIYQAEFAEFIGRELSGIRDAVSVTLEMADIDDGAVQTVLLTGGSSMVRQVRAQLEGRFPKADVKLDTDRFNTVSLGLAFEARLRALSV